jgi:hypothetical protein
MAFPLATVLTAAPGLIAAAADIIRVIRERKQPQSPEQAPSDAQRLDEMTALIEKQAMLIEELAVNNQQLSLAVRNNRLLALGSIGIALLAVALAAVLAS